MVAQWLALLPHSARDPGLIPGLGHSVEFSHSPHVCVGSSGAPVSSHSLKDVPVRHIGHAKFSLSVPKQCGNWGIFTITSLQC